MTKQRADNRELNSHDTIKGARVVYFTKGRRSGGSSRHRAFNWADALNQAGHEAQVIIPPIYQVGSRTTNRLNYLRTIFSLRRRDTVILQTTIFNSLFIILMHLVKALFRPTVIFDFDDAIYINNPKATKTLTGLADKIIVASYALAKWRKLKGKPVLIMPNLIDIELAEKYTKHHENTIQPILGWGGGAPESLNNLALLVPVFEQLVTKGVNFKFKLVGTLGDSRVESLFKDINGLETEFIDQLDWAKVGEIQKAYASFDIGLGPLLDNEDNRARCLLKLLDYMSVGLPAVASPVGENNNFIEHGSSGYLADSIDQWVDKLTSLIKSHELRRKLGQAAQQRIKEKYSYRARLNEYISFIK